MGDEARGIIIESTFEVGRRFPDHVFDAVEIRPVFWKFRSSSLPARQNSPGSAVGVREIFDDDRNFDQE